ncbi:MAG: type I-C CRISPR-associated protein Cas7/Csd2 [Holophagaceae bacterium]|nr:type I-C CRISPR-associated protein Cas7/Csd2 [Holophagaceae bacterium]
MTLTKRYDFVLFFDVQDGNPNGDPDAGNLPRVDAETGMGLVTDVCLKRKVRNYVQLAKKSQVPFDIFVKSKEISGIETILNKEIRIGYEELCVDLQSEQDADGKKRKDKGSAQGSEVAKGRDYLCAKFFDIRTFGAVMSTGPNAGQVRGPIQLTFARSVEPVVALEHALTVSAARMEEKGYEEQVGIQGRKYTVPYGLYCAHGFVSAHLASQTGFTQDDLNLFWQALEDMFDHDHSAARGLMTTRRLVIFEHETALGNAHASDLFDRVTWKRTTEGPARAFTDYELLLDGKPLPVIRTMVPVH